MITRFTSSLRRRRSARRRSPGFSLVEVCIALAVVAFALLPMVALLPVGMTSFSNASIRGRAVQVISQIAACLQLANSTPSVTGLQYTALAPFDATTATMTIQWTSPGGGAPATYGPFYFDGAGNATTLAAGNARMIAVVAISAPASALSPGTATITVAWPPTATVAWNGITPQFTNIQGHEESTIPLSPIFQ